MSYTSDHVCRRDYSIESLETSSFNFVGQLNPQTQFQTTLLNNWNDIPEFLLDVRHACQYRN